MAVTCRNIMELDSCKQLKLIGGANGIDKEIRWPFIKNMDTISEWIHGGELIFMLGAKEDTSEKGLLYLMKEALKNEVSGVVMLYGDQYIRTIPKSVIRFADEHEIALFKMPFRLKLIDITQDISRFILQNQEISRSHLEHTKQTVLELLLKGADKETLLGYCFTKLQPLIEADRVLKREYVMTLYQYLQNNNELLETSKKMYIHRNTLLNRMKKIQSLLEFDINDSKETTDLCNVYDILNYYGKLDWK